MANFNPIARNQFLVQINKVGIDSYWETCSDIKLSRQTSEYTDGLSLIRYKKVGTTTVENITLGKAFDPVVDQPIIQFYTDFCASPIPVTVTIQPMNFCPQVAPLGKAAVLYNVQPIELTYPGADKKSGDMATLQLTLAVDYFKYE